MLTLNTLPDFLLSHVLRTSRNFAKTFQILSLYLTPAYLGTLPYLTYLLKPLRGTIGRTRCTPDSPPIRSRVR